MQMVLTGFDQDRESQQSHQQPLIEEVVCPMVENENQASSTVTKYASKLQYHCPSGKQFQMFDDNDKPYLQESFETTCTWDQTWSPESVLPDCACK